MKSFKEVLEYLNSLINYEVEFPLGGSRDRPKLEPVYAAARVLGLPLTLPKCIHIAGTVGKGSTAAMSQALLSVHHRVLSFTSPHLVSPKERVRLDGLDIPDDVWCEGMSAIREGTAASGTKLTYFETTFAFYLWCAKTLGSTAHVVETGLGGSFDATNVLEETTAVMTRIDLDHTHILGKTHTEIARDKSGIIKEHANCFCSEQSAEALIQIEMAATARRAKLLVEGREFCCTVGESGEHSYSGSRSVNGIVIPLRGDFQRHNLAVSIAAVLSLDESLPDQSIRDALGRLKLQGRQQSLVSHPNIMIDVCHNPASFEELASSLKRESRFARRIALVAMMKDKDAKASLAHLRGIVDEVWVTTAPTPRTHSAESLLEFARQEGIKARVVERSAAYKELLELRTDTQAIVCGSFYLVGDFLSEYGNA